MLFLCASELQFAICVEIIEGKKKENVNDNTQTLHSCKVYIAI
jgi:hypothetical protein